MPTKALNMKWALNEKSIYINDMFVYIAVVDGYEHDHGREQIIAWWCSFESEHFQIDLFW